jgi:hypothetical protein
MVVMAMSMATYSGNAPHAFSSRFLFIRPPRQFSTGPGRSAGRAAGGTMRAQLKTLLGHLNAHATATSSVHPVISKNSIEERFLSIPKVVSRCGLSTRHLFGTSKHLNVRRGLQRPRQPSARPCEPCVGVARRGSSMKCRREIRIFLMLRPGHSGFSPRPRTRQRQVARQPHGVGAPM